jgi:hypothetical protein
MHGHANQPGSGTRSSGSEDDGSGRLGAVVPLHRFDARTPRGEPGALAAPAGIRPVGGEQSPFSNRDAKGKHKVIAQGTISFLSSHFPSSTCAEAFPRPDRVDAGAVERRSRQGWPLLRATARFGLDADRARRHTASIGVLFFSSPYRGNIRPSAECIVLFAVGPRARRTMVFEGFGAAMSLTRSQMSREDSRGRRDPSRQGRRFTAKRAVNRCERELFESDQAMASAGAGTAVRRNGSPVVHMRCRMTASLRATAIVAFFLPMRLASVWPHACKSLGFADRLSRTFAASYRRARTIPSPHFETRPAWSTSPD